MWRGVILLTGTDLVATFAHAQFALYWTNEEVHLSDVNSTALIDRKPQTINMDLNKYSLKDIYGQN